MLKVVEVHPANSVRGEYVVLQNQGVVSVSLRGWALCSDAYLDGNVAEVAAQMYIFRDDISIRPYTRVVLFTGPGEDGWLPTNDGRQAYCAYWGRCERLWSTVSAVHVLHLSATRRLIQEIHPLAAPESAILH